MNDRPDRNPDLQPPFAKLMGMNITHLSPDKIVAELFVRDDLENRMGVLHDLPPGARTSTIESKTNFFAPIPIGDTAHAECTPLHRGRSTMVWQTRITRNDGRLCAIVTQTQIVIPAGKE